MTPQQYSTPDDFLEQVKDALEHLYDFPYLQNHPLANMAQSKGDSSSQSPAQHLRRELMDVIDTLSPGPDVPFRSPHARLYNVLHLHYVEGMTVQETANELGISLRQAYRDLRRSEESVAAILWSRIQQTPPVEPKAMRLSSIQEEMARLESHPRPTDIQSLLQQAQKAVSSLAKQNSLSFKLETPPEPVVVAIDPVIAHQVLVNILSQVVKQAQPGIVRFVLDDGEKGTSLTLRYAPEPGASGLAVIDPVVVHLTDHLGWKIQQADSPDPVRTVTIHVVTHGPTVLVVDDNEGLVELLGRYLTGHNCRVAAALSGQEGLKLTQELLPDAIVLDVMMPEMDGWEFLQRLRANSQTTDIPVIICSVFNDPELAYSLGASAILAKPVRRQDILDALRKLGVV